MIDSFEELWNKMQAEFIRIDGKFTNVDNNMKEGFKKVNGRIDEEFEKVNGRMDEEFGKVNGRMDEEFGKVNGRMDEEFEKVDDRMDEEFGKVNGRIDEEFGKIYQRFTNIDDKLDVITNVNLAQILNEFTRTRNEFNNKLDKHITKDEFEHKRIDYKLAEIEMKYKYSSNE